MAPQVEAVKLRGATQGKLTPREQQILDLACTNLSYKEVAGRLGISLATVQVYILRISKKRNIRGRVVVDELLRRLNEQSYYGA